MEKQRLGVHRPCETGERRTRAREAEAPVQREISSSGKQRPAHLTARPGQSLCHRGGDLLLRGWILPRRFERLGRGLLLGPPLAVGLPVVRVVSPEPHERSTRRLRGLLSQREEREAEGGGGRRREEKGGAERSVWWTIGCVGKRALSNLDSSLWFRAGDVHGVGVVGRVSFLT